MDEKEILQRQVEALEKLLQIKEAIIVTQEEKISRLEREAVAYPGINFPPPPPHQPVFIPSIWQSPPDVCPDGSPHDYPNPWFSTQPAPCKKCGKLAPSFTVTCTNDSNNP